jgi:hypothetical protein
MAAHNNINLSDDDLRLIFMTVDLSSEFESLGDSWYEVDEYTFVHYDDKEDSATIRIYSDEERKGTHREFRLKEPTLERIKESIRDFKINNLLDEK